MRGAKEFNNLEDWVNHKTRTGGNSAFLKGWKEKPGHIDTWMHIARLPMAVWQHPFPTPTMVKDKQSQEQVKNIFSKKYTCHETEDVLTKPFHDKDTGARDVPPQRCGICKFTDWLWIEILQWVQSHRWVENEEDKRQGKWVEKQKGKGTGIDPAMRIFNFVSDADAKQNVRISAGGFCGYFGQKAENLDWGVKKAMAAAGIRGDEAWKEVGVAKCGYAMTIVDNDAPENGLRIAVETQALGEAVKKVITDTMKSMEVNIQKEPYCIQWEYFPKEDFSKKYKATSLMKKKPSPRILKLIRGEAPDLTELKTPFDQKKMLALFEKNCLLKEVPWDEIFPTEKQLEKWAKEDETEADEDEAAAKNSRKSSQDDDDEEPSKSKKDEEEDDEEEDEDDEKEESEDDDDETVACDNPKCKKPMKLSDSECPHCGKKYDVEGDEEPEPPKEEKKIPTRAEVAERKAAAAKKAEASPKASAKEKKSKKKDDEDEEEEVDADAEIPF